MFDFRRADAAHNALSRMSSKIDTYQSDTRRRQGKTQRLGEAHMLGKAALHDGSGVDYVENGLRKHSPVMLPHRFLVTHNGEVSCAAARRIDDLLFFWRP